MFNILQKLQEDLEKKGLILKKHEDNVKFLKTQENSLNDTILDLQSMVYYHLPSSSDCT